MAICCPPAGRAQQISLTAIRRRQAIDDLVSRALGAWRTRGEPQVRAGENRVLFPEEPF